MAVIVRGSHIDGVYDPQHLGDTLFKLVQAPDGESAHQRALEMGQDAEDDYTDDEGKTVQLRFLGLADLREIDAEAIGDGTEVYSEIIPTKPDRRVVDKDRLTALERDEPLEEIAAEDVEPEDPGRFSDDTPIR